MDILERGQSVTRPKVSEGCHPIETTEYLIGTRVIQDLFETLCKWINSRATGGIVHGPPRNGKSDALKYVKGLLKQRFGVELPVFSFPCRFHTHASEVTFFEELLRAFGHRMVVKGNAAAKRHRLLEFIYEKANAKTHNRIILFIDEAQLLYEQHYKWLIDLHNELSELNVTLIVILVGQHQLLHQCSGFIEGSQDQIVGRFMAHRFEFKGLRGISDVKVCLKGYDEVSEHPAGSGWSYSRYFFPAAFASGWRMASSAGALWEAFRQIREETALPPMSNLPMMYFCRTAEAAMTRFGTLEDEAPILSIAAWKEAIRDSGYIDAQSYTDIPEPQ